MQFANSTFEKIAADLAQVAVTGTTTAAVRQIKAAFITPDVERYLLHGLLGAGAGVGLGALQPEKKKRNILYYGALGGLGGLGLSKLTQTNAAAPQTKTPDLSMLQKMQLKGVLRSKIEDQDKYKQLVGMATAVNKQ